MKYSLSVLNDLRLTLFSCYISLLHFIVTFHFVSFRLVLKPSSVESFTGVDPGFFLGGGAPVKNGVTDFFFLQNTSCIRKPQVISGGVAHPLHPPPRSAPALVSRTNMTKTTRFSNSDIQWARANQRHFGGRTR